jgi:hypothetical protein
VGKERMKEKEYKKELKGMRVIYSYFVLHCMTTQQGSSTRLGHGTI